MDYKNSITVLNDGYRGVTERENAVSLCTRDKDWIQHWVLYNFRILNVKRHRSHPPHNINSFELVALCFKLYFSLVNFSIHSAKWWKIERNESCTRPIDIHDKHVPNHLRALYSLHRFVILTNRFIRATYYTLSLSVFLHIFNDFA